jgi:hypothetical protein
VRKSALLEPPLLALVPSGWQFTEWVASVRKIYDSGDKTAAMDLVLAGAYGQDYRRFTDVALPAGDQRNKRLQRRARIDPGATE